MITFTQLDCSNFRGTKNICCHFHVMNDNTNNHFLFLEAIYKRREEHYGYRYCYACANSLKGIHQSGSMIFGEQEKVQVVTFANEGLTTCTLASKMPSLNIWRPSCPRSLLVWVTDWPYQEEKSWSQMVIVTGLNLPMLINIYRTYGSSWCWGWRVSLTFIRKQRRR